MENNEVLCLRDLTITKVSCVTAPSTQMCEVPFMYAGTCRILKRPVKMYYVTFCAKGKFEDYACVIMTPDFGKINTIHSYLCNAMETGERIGEITGCFNDTRVVDVQIIVPQKFMFYV